MKRTIQLLVLLLAFSSCNTLFHPEETSYSNITGYDELVEAANGVCGEMLDALSSLYCYTINLNGDDLSIYNSNYPSFYGDSNCRLNGIKCETSYTWDVFYSVLASVNNILSQKNLSSAIEVQTREILGEMYFFRAYCHLRLTRTYGRIPIVDDNDVSYTTPKATYAELYESIENDLLTAISLLPERNSSARIPYETPTRGTAKALLAEVYLSWAGYPTNDVSKYALAVGKAKEVIDSAAYLEVGLMDDFSFLWDKQHAYNQEGLFSCYYKDPSVMVNTEGINGLYYGQGLPYPNGSGFLTYPDSTYVTLGYFSAELNFFNSFPSNYRKDITFFSSIYVPSEYYTTGGVDTGYVHIDHVSDCNRIGFRKFYYNMDIVPMKKLNPEYPFDDLSSVFGMNRVYILRYAQTLLTYAESAARSGQLNDKAYECVNQIRRRANHVDLNTPSVYDLQPGLSAEAFADSVVQERAWELAGEPEGRWFDIVRLNMIKELPSLRDPGEGGPPTIFDESAYFWDIPQSEIDLNPNLAGE